MKHTKNTGRLNAEKSLNTCILSNLLSNTLCHRHHLGLGLKNTATVYFYSVKRGVQLDVVRGLRHLQGSPIYSSPLFF